MRQAHQARSAAHGHGGRRCGDWVRHGSRVEGVRQGHVPVVSHFSTAHGGCRRRAGPPRPEVLLDAVVLKHVQHLVRAAAGGLIRDRPDICIRHQLLLPLLLLLLTVLLERLIPQLPHASSGVPHAGGVFRGAHCSGWSNADGRCMCWWLVAVTSGIGSGATSSDAAAMRNWWRPVRALRPSGQPPGAGALGAGRSNETLQHSGSALGRYGRRGLPERCRRCVSSVGLPLLRWHPTCHLLH
mmetsp:Transcript_4624/g.13939  ORF Transcript_4624/g.13939 Transcript_4624/m.13939 type:complete len:241 (-) Transcript_4624:686-1408(-)